MTLGLTDDEARGLVQLLDMAVTRGAARLNLAQSWSGFDAEFL